LGPSRHEQGRQQILLQLVDWQTQPVLQQHPSDEQRNHTVDDPEAYLYYKAFFTTTTDDEDVPLWNPPLRSLQ
jgi:hypothetical protein